ncbi:MAG TPA: hypothetical protein VJ821_02120 [Anaerolineales bacterium]|nr:hypothetical protein [Anaerolineales bacterium]
MKQTIKSIYRIILAALLTACGMATPRQTAVPTITPVPSSTSISSTATSIPQATATPTSSITLTSAPYRLLLAYMVDKNLYFQKGSNPPVKLTHSADDRYPLLSDDGEILIFYRGLVPHELYSIRTDGTQEKVLVTGSLLESLGLGYDEFTEIISLAFVPGTHQVMFHTRQLSQSDIDMQDFNRLGSAPNMDLLSIDADTGEIKSLLPRGQGSSFLISPDGSRVDVIGNGHIDVIDINGRMFRKNLVRYTPTQPYRVAPRIFWVEDSTELIVTLSAETEYNFDGPEIRSVWRYTIADGAKVQIPYAPPLIGFEACVSPDGNWILYDYFYYPGKTDETITDGLYLGNLHDGSSQIYELGMIVTRGWSADNIHFLYEGFENEIYLGSIDQQPEFTGNKGRFLGWLDLNHYLFYSTSDEAVVGVMGEIDGETTFFPIAAPASSLSGGAGSFTFVYLDH